MKKLFFSAITILLLPIVAISILLFTKRNVFDNPDFWYGYMAYFGTVILGAIAVWQNISAQKTNERLTKENNNLQKIIVQKTLPIIKVESISSHSSTFVSTIANVPETKNTFSISRTYKERQANSVVRQLLVNIDTAQNDRCFQKLVSLKIINISDAFVRHIAIDQIEISGYAKEFDSIVCYNQVAGNGFSDLLAANDAVEIKVAFFTSDERKAAIWDSPLGGLAFTLYLTNTTINGIQFHEFISINVTDEGYSKVSYGEKTIKHGG